MASKDNNYYYQRFEWKKLDLARKADFPDWHVFLNKIQLSDRERLRLTDSYQQLLDDFATHIMGNIHWYEKKIIWEKTVRLTYILISLSLLILVPMLVALIQRYTQSVSAEITAIFTGIFALYQGVSKWLESRNVIANYWQTSSNLKSRLYSLEDKWSYTHLDGWTDENLEELVLDLRAAVKYGIESQKAEKQLFFDNYSYPQFDLIGMILGKRAQVQELLKREKSSDRKGEIDLPPPVAARKKLADLTGKADEPTVKRNQ